MPCLTLLFRPSSLFAFHFLSILFSYPPPFSFLTFLVSFPLFSPPLSLSLPFSFVSSYILSFFPCHLIPFRFHAFSFRGRNEVSVACYRFYNYITVNVPDFSVSASRLSLSRRSNSSRSPTFSCSVVERSLSSDNFSDSICKQQTPSVNGCSPASPR